MKTNRLKLQGGRLGQDVWKNFLTQELFSMKRFASYSSGHALKVFQQRLNENMADMLSALSFTCTEQGVGLNDTQDPFLL